MRHAFRLDTGKLTLRRLFTLRRRAGRFLRYLRGEAPNEQEMLLDQAGLLDQIA